MNNNYFIFQYEDDDKTSKMGIVTAVFVHQEIIQNKNSFSQEINRFFQENALSDKIVVILGSYLDQKSKKFITNTPEVAFERLPGNSKDFFDNSLLVYTYDVNGELKLVKGETPLKESEFLSYLFRSGSTTLFKKNGGLVESTPDHHFVFPSGKHCAKFLRTGNVLINHPEIFFLSVQLLPKFKDVNSVYCDTASINVLPYTVFELYRRFGEKFHCPPVYSFESYEYFEKRNSRFPPDSLILISSSTSGGIINRLIEKVLVTKSQISLLYFLGSANDFKANKEQILCNLTYDDSFNIGLQEVHSAMKNETCSLCLNNSRPIPIQGDVFLTIQPQVNLHTLTTKPIHSSKEIVEFIERFRGIDEESTILKTYNKDDATGKENYEIYIDYSKLIENINKSKFEGYKESLNKNIDKYIPANTKLILNLPDKGSKKLGDYVLKRTTGSIAPIVLDYESSWEGSLIGVKGTLVIVGSCISSGKKLLQISRILRKFSDISLVYFIGIFRPVNFKYSKNLISNLSKGSTISDNRPVIVVEKIFCSNEKRNTSWVAELTFINEVLTEIDEEEFVEISEYLNLRRDILIQNKVNNGLSNNVFLNTITSDALILNKNFAFWGFKYEENEVSQSELYFQISCIINNLTNKDITDSPSLSQSNYVRNLLSPGNFSRFNDGIIQAALLRAGSPDCFSYDLDRIASQEMKEQLMSMLDKIDTHDSDALPEFLLAIGLKKMKLTKDDMTEFLLAASNCQNEIISGLGKYLQKYTI